MANLKSAWAKTGNFIIIAVAIALSYLVGSGTFGGSITTRWYWVMAIMFVFILLIGITVNGRLDGALVDWRNKMSLSHLQVILWTVLGMSAFLTIGLTRISVMDKIAYDLDSAYEQARIVGGVECLKDLSANEVTQDVLDKCPAPDPLQIIFPEELLLAMGISLTSFAGSSLIKSNQSNTRIISANEESNLRGQISKLIIEKKEAMGKVQGLIDKIGAEQIKKDIAKEEGKTDDVGAAEQVIKDLKNQQKLEQQKAESAVKKIDEKQKELEKTLADWENAKGLLHTNKTPQEAEWSDIFKKEKSGEQYLIDLSKVQMFFFTITLIFAYAAALNSLMQDPGLIENPFGVALPAFSASLVVLLGISHSGYLVTKNTDMASTGTKKE